MLLEINNNKDYNNLAYVLLNKFKRTINSHAIEWKLIQYVSFFIAEIYGNGVNILLTYIRNDINMDYSKFGILLLMLFIGMLLIGLIV